MSEFLHESTSAFVDFGVVDSEVFAVFRIAIELTKQIAGNF